jgi:hypothetical protein
VPAVAQVAWYVTCAKSLRGRFLLVKAEGTPPDGVHKNDTSRASNNTSPEDADKNHTSLRQDKNDTIPARLDVLQVFERPLTDVLQVLGAPFTCFTGTKVQILTQICCRCTR